MAICSNYIDMYLKTLLSVLKFCIKMVSYEYYLYCRWMSFGYCHFSFLIKILFCFSFANELNSSEELLFKYDIKITKMNTYTCIHRATIRANLQIGWNLSKFVSLPATHELMCKNVKLMMTVLDFLLLKNMIGLGLNT